MIFLRKFSGILGRIAAVGALLLGSLGVHFSTAAPASADEGWFMLGNYRNGLCMHASSGGGAGAWVTQENCNQYETRQWWRWMYMGHTQVLQNYSGMCLDSYNGNNPGTVIVYYCNGGSTQYFVWFSESRTLEVNFAGDAVEPPSLSNKPGTQLIMWSRNGTPNQQWWSQRLS
ncbi:RICIN domain-containing protein [Streptomyces sp. NPDC006544]|uniref:RICIN domain-containing protein n=1 Tax=Streptomyces sp. NPDC006544 TaxID=3154583 RepID=UPI0033B7F66A